MPHPITIPRLGWSMEEGVFAEWLKAPGETVRAGDMLFLLEGEKAATEIESLDSGRLCVPPDAPRPGATVKVGEVIGFLLAEGESAPPTVRVPPTTPASASNRQHSSPTPRVLNRSPRSHRSRPAWPRGCPAPPAPRPDDWPANSEST